MRPNNIKHVIPSKDEHTNKNNQIPTNSIKYLNLPRKKSEIEKTIMQNIGKNINIVKLDTTIGKKILAQIVFLLKPSCIQMPFSIARRINIKSMIKQKITINIENKKRGRKQKANARKLKQQLEKGIIKRRTYYYWKRKIRQKK